MSTGLSGAALGAMTSAALLVMIGAIFGACLARLLWAEDLKFTLHLQEIWKRTEASMRETIRIQNETIDTLRHKP